MENERPGEKPEEKLLREIREDFTYYRDFWRENYAEAKTDLKFVSGDPWETADRKAREDNGRPVLSPDELDQYLNQAINNLRQNPLGIKVEPKGEGATDQDAQMRQSIIRNIEYDSTAEAAYTNAFSCAINCGFGFFRVTTKKVKKGSDDVEPRIKIINNPMSVLMDPISKEADFSDMKRCFVMDTIRKTDFGRMYPNADKKSFTVDDQQIAPDWFDGENIVVAEYWRIDDYDDDGEGGKVSQYITNGLEILDTREWAGTRVPIIPVLGKEVYVPMGGKMSRMFYSMIRKARGPQMMMAYIASQEAEEYGMAPRAPFVGYVGQFETDADAWTTLNKVPRAFVQVDPMVDQGNGSPLPLPTRPQFTPNAQAYEVSKESWRRSIQSAMGISPLPTSAQRQNEKSGVALERIQTQQSVGSYHFTANFKRSLQNAGHQINELITKVLDTKRQVAGRADSGEQKLMQVSPGGQAQQSSDQQVFDPTKGDFDVTISTGPSYQSQREEASAFADTLVQQIDALPVPPAAKSKLIALAVKLKDIGPLGDEMAEILDPQQNQQVPPQVQQQMAEMQQQLQLAHHLGQQLYQKVQEMEFEKKADTQKQQGQMQIERMKLEASITIAEINTKAQNEAERGEFVRDIVKQTIAQSHEAAMSQMEAGQQQQLQAQSAQNASDQSAQDADEASAQSSQDAGQASQQSAQDAQAQQDSASPA